MQLSYKDYQLCSLCIDGSELALPWGIEFADETAFYSAERGVGYRYKEIVFDESVFESGCRKKSEVQLKEACLGLDSVYIEESPEVLMRTLDASVRKGGFLMDFVMRFRFLSSEVDYVDIADIRLMHNDSNKYYQYNVNEVALKLKTGKVIKIELNEIIAPSDMEAVMYARDQKGEWVIHCRLIPKVYGKEVIKICTAWAGTRSLPYSLSKFLLNFGCIRKKLWYRTEQRPFKSKIMRYIFNFSAYPLAKVSEADKVKLVAKLTVI